MTEHQDTVGEEEWARRRAQERAGLENMRRLHPPLWGPVIESPRTPGQLELDRITQVPAGQVPPPAETHWDRLARAGERLRAEQDEHYRTGRTAAHGGREGE